MKNLRKLAAGAALSVLSTASLADIWEPGVGVRVNYAPLQEVEGDSGNKMEGDRFGLALRYASASETPVNVGLSYEAGSSDHSGDSQYSSAEADSSVFAADLAVGKVFFPGDLELIPYIGLGFRQMGQEFSSSAYPENNDIATPERTHRHLYLPIGVYLGSSSPLDQFDFYISTEYRQILMGEAKLERDGGTTMNSNDGRGFRAEAGIHFPSNGLFNVYAGVYYEQWDIDAPDKGASVIEGVTKTVSEPGTNQISSGVTLGLQF